MEGRYSVFLRNGEQICLLSSINKIPLLGAGLQFLIKDLGFQGQSSVGGTNPLHEFHPPELFLHCCPVGLEQQREQKNINLLSAEP